MKNNKKTANLFAITSILLWCFSGVCFRKGADIFEPMTYLGLITMTGVITAFFIHIIQRRKVKDLFILPKRIMISGFFGITIYTIFLAFAFNMAKPEEIGTINLINYLWPIWMVAIEIILIKSKAKLNLLILGILLGFIGLLITLNINLKELNTENLYPHLMALSGGLFWAFYSVLLKKWHISEEHSGTSFHFTVCAILSFILAIVLKENIRSINWSGEAIFWVLFGGIGPVGIAYYLWELGIKKGSVSFIASLSYFIPIGSSIVISLFFPETLSKTLIPASILIASGSLFVKRAVRNS